MNEEYSKHVLTQAAARATNEANQLGGLADGGLGFEYEELGDTTESFAAAKLRVMAKKIERGTNYRESMIEAAKLIAQLSNLKQMTSSPESEEPMPSFLSKSVPAFAKPEVVDLTKKETQ